MAHLVESLMYVREKPWHSLGTMVMEAPNSAEAIKLAGLDWEVHAKPIFTDAGFQIPGYVANTRSSDNSILGVVTDKYKVVQNKDAFAFTDALIGNDCRYETAGSLKSGRTVWMLARLPDTKILDDDVERYLCFMNTHDGTGAVRVFSTNVRVVCNNTLNIALNNAQRSWSCKHMGNMEDKLAEASHTLKLANKYIDELKVKADEYAHTTFSMDEVNKVVAELFPINEEDTDRHKETMKKCRSEFLTCYFMPDIEKFRGTKWGLINAASDFVSHVQPKRNTSTYQERNFERIIVGHPVFDKVVEMMNVKA